MMIRRAAKLIAVSTAAVLALAACASPQSGDQEDRLRIGVTVNSTNAFLTSGKEGLEAYAQANNIELLYKSAEGDVAKQATQIEDFVRAGVDGILVIPVQSDSLRNQVGQANSAGVPVVAVNTSLNDAELAGSVIPSDVQAGRDITTLLGEHLGGEGNIVVLQGSIGQSTQILRDEGVQAAIEEDFPGIKILANDSGEWSRDAAANRMANWITAFGDDIDGVVAHNDDMALGALQALREKGLNVPVVGIDGIQDGLDAVVAGEFLGTMLQHGAVEIASGLALLVQIIQGDATETELTYTMPLITADNIDEYYGNIVTDRKAFLEALPAIIDRNLADNNLSNEAR